MKLVVVESPYAGDIRKNTEYARACVRDSLLRGEAPIASHLLYPQPGILREEIASERQHGIEAGLAWLPKADLMAVYIDNGVSFGMSEAQKTAESLGITIEHRRLRKNG